MDLIRSFFGQILFYIYSLIGNYGWAIVVFTILTKVLLLPLNIKQSKSMKKMNELQPKLKELQDKYKNDKEKLNQKTMELYKEHNASPFGGCLPLLIQLPIIIALFAVLRQPEKFVFVNTGIDYATDVAKGFLWIKDLSLPDVFKATAEGTRNGLYILPVLSGLTTYFQTKTAPTPPAANGQKNQSTQMMSTMMPVLIGFMSLQFAAGLALYWVVGNIFTIIQQMMTNGTLLKPKEE